MIKSTNKSSSSSSSSSTNNRPIVFMFGKSESYQKVIDRYPQFELIDISLLWPYEYRSRHSETLQFIAWELSQSLQAKFSILDALKLLESKGNDNEACRYLLTRGPISMADYLVVAEKYMKVLNQIERALAKREKDLFERVRELSIQQRDPVDTDRVIIVLRHENRVDAVLLVPKSWEIIEIREKINQVAEDILHPTARYDSRDLDNKKDDSTTEIIPVNNSDKKSKSKSKASKTPATSVKASKKRSGSSSNAHDSTEEYSAIPFEMNSDSAGPKETQKKSKNPNIHLFTMTILTINSRRKKKSLSK